MKQDEIIDCFGRSFRKLRISLTPECNFSCLYCVSHMESRATLKKVGLKNIDYLEIVSSLLELLNIEEVKLTGGEPTLYPKLTNLIYELKKIVPKVSLTTNGYLLGKLVPELKQAGLDSVNVSLDSLNEKTFSLMSRGRKLCKTLESIDLLQEYKIPFKLNTTVLKGYNEKDILSLLEFAGKKKVAIRFIEYMKMGNLQTYSSFSKWFYSKEEILSKIKEHYSINLLPTSPSSTAEYWKTNTGFIFGIIANESSPFCKSCDRLRLDYQGNIFGCLSSSIGFPVFESHKNKKELKKNLQKALFLKQKEKFKGSNLVMRYIGG